MRGAGIWARQEAGFVGSTLLAGSRGCRSARMFVDPEHVCGTGPDYRADSQKRQAQRRERVSPGCERPACLLAHGRSDARDIWITVMAKRLAEN